MLKLRKLITSIRQKQDNHEMTQQQGQRLLLAWDAVQQAILLKQLAARKALLAVHECYDEFGLDKSYLDLQSMEQIELDLLRLSGYNTLEE